MHRHTHRRPLHSFPTRRSSDLFVRELPAGTPFSIHGAVVYRRGETFRFYQEIRNVGLGVVAATIVTDMVLADSRTGDRKSTRLNSSHVRISYAVFCLKKKTRPKNSRIDQIDPDHRQPLRAESGSAETAVVGDLDCSGLTVCRRRAYNRPRGRVRIVVR